MQVCLDRAIYVRIVLCQWEETNNRRNERTNGKMTEKSKMCMRVELVKWMVREGGVLSAKTMVRGNMAQKCYRAVNVVYV